MHKIIFFLVSVFSMSLLQASDLFRAIESKNYKEINRLLKNNIDTEALNAQGQTLLIKAVQAKNSSLVAKLLKKGATVNGVDLFGKTALDYAVELSNKNIAKMLIEADALVTSQENVLKCKQLVRSIWSMYGWWIFRGFMVGILCFCTIVLAGAGFVVVSFIGNVCSGANLPVFLGLGSLITVGAIATLTYGIVKMFQANKNQYYDVDIMGIAAQ